MPWIKFLSGRTCILLWILYGNMVDFSFIVSLYVSDLPKVRVLVRVPYCSMDHIRIRVFFVLLSYSYDHPRLALAMSSSAGAATEDFPSRCFPDLTAYNLVVLIHGIRDCWILRV